MSWFYILVNNISVSLIYHLLTYETYLSIQYCTDKTDRGPQARNKHVCHIQLAALLHRNLTVHL